MRLLAGYVMRLVSYWRAIQPTQQMIEPASRLYLAVYYLDASLLAPSVNLWLVVRLVARTGKG